MGTPEIGSTNLPRSDSDLGKWCFQFSGGGWLGSRVAFWGGSWPDRLVKQVRSPTDQSEEKLSFTECFFFGTLVCSKACSNRVPHQFIIHCSDLGPGYNPFGSLFQTGPKSQRSIKE